MQVSINQNTSTAFESAKSSLYTEAIELEQASSTTFEYVANDVKFDANNYSPDQNTHYILNIGPDQFSRNYASCGQGIAGYDMASFPNLTANRDYRLSADNWQSIYEGPCKVYSYRHSFVEKLYLQAHG